MFTQLEYKGYDIKKMKREYNKLVKQYLKLGNTQEKAEEKALFMVDYYKHQYRVYA